MSLAMSQRPPHRPRGGPPCAPRLRCHDCLCNLHGPSPEWTLPPRRSGGLLECGPAAYLFLAPRRRPRPATVFLGPLRVREFVRVRWPRTGRPRR